MTAYLLALLLGADIYVQAGASGGDGGQAAPFSTVQRGVDVAAPGDTVHLLPGTYLENVQVTKNGVRLVSDPPWAATIDGRNAGKTLEVVGVNWTLDGLRLLNGSRFNLEVRGSPSWDCAAGPVPGGVELARLRTGGTTTPSSGSCPNTTGDSNSYDVSVSCLAGRVAIHDSQFLANACTANLEVWSVTTGPVTVQDNELSGAHWNLLLIDDVHGAEVTRNWLHGPCCDGVVGSSIRNTAGIFVLIPSTNVFVHHNLVVRTGDVGIGAYDFGNAESAEGLEVRNNTIIGPRQCGVLFNAVSGTARSNLVSGVSCSSCKYCSAPSGFCMVNSEGTASGVPVASSGWDLFEGLTAAPYCTASQATNNRLGTVSAAAPMFVSADAGDYRLRAGSPAIDTGDPASDAGLDFAGLPFPQRGTAGGTPRADIGAFEYQPPLTPDGGPDGGGPDGGDGGALADGGPDAGNDGGPEADGGTGALAVIEPAAQTVAVGELVQLDARGSRASAGATLVHYRWSEPQGPTGLALEDAPQLSFTAREPGSYLVRLVVEDSSGASSAPVTAALYVSGEVYSPPATLPGCGCGAPGAAGVALLGLALLGLLRRRR